MRLTSNPKGSIRLNSWGIFALFLFVSTQSSYAQGIEEFAENALKEKTKPHFAISLDPLRMFNGEYTASLQYAPLAGISFEFGTGVTAYNEFLNLKTDTEEMLSTRGSVVTKMLPMAVIAIKFFPEADIYSNSYYGGIEFRHRKYRRELNFNTSDIQNSQIKVGETINDIGFIFGYHLLPGTSRFFVDCYAGYSIRIIKYAHPIGDQERSTANSSYYSVQEIYNYTTGYQAGIKVSYILDAPSEE